jgi:hypothetical protein
MPYGSRVVFGTFPLHLEYPVHRHLLYILGTQPSWRRRPLSYTRTS